MKTKLNDININYELMGENNDETVLLIHGFPDSMKVWRKIAPKLVESGFKVIKIDLPGYGESDIPNSVEESKVDNICDILKQLLDELNINKTHVIGHDWGAAIGWYFSSIYTNTVKSYIPLSVGHPSGFKNSGFDQLVSSWYVLLILNEDLGEKVFTADDWSLFKTLFTGEELHENWLPDMSRDGRLTSAFNLYRANLSPKYGDNLILETSKVEAPVLAFLGENDPALTEDQLKLSEDCVKNDFNYNIVKNKGHWLPLDAYSEIYPEIKKFLYKYSENPHL